MQKIKIIVLIFCGMATLLNAQNPRWERIDTTYYTDLTMVGNLLFTQQHYHLGEKIARLRYSENQGKTWLPLQYLGNVAPDLTKIIRHPKYLLSLFTKIIW